MKMEIFHCYVSLSEGKTKTYMKILDESNRDLYKVVDFSETQRIKDYCRD